MLVSLKSIDKFVYLGIRDLSLSLPTLREFSLRMLNAINAKF